MCVCVVCVCVCMCVLSMQVCTMYPCSFQNRVWIPAELMHEILGEVHYMPDKWKQRPHTVEVYKEYTQVFQFTLVSPSLSLTIHSQVSSCVHSLTLLLYTVGRRQCNGRILSIAVEQKHMYMCSMYETVH